MGKNFKVFLLIMIILLGIGFSYMLFFDEAFLSTVYEYKYENLKSEKTQIEELTGQMQSYKNEVLQNKSQINQTKTDIENENNNLLSIKRDSSTLVLPENVDYASLLIFIEEQAMLNDVYIRNIELVDNNLSESTGNNPDMTEQTQNTDINNTSSNTPENMVVKNAQSESIENIENNSTKNNGNTTNNASGNKNTPKDGQLDQTPIPSDSINQGSLFSSSKVRFGIIGSYENVERFIKNFNTKVGEFNYINSLNLYRGKKEAYSIEGAKDLKVQESDYKPKNIFVNIELYLNYK